MKFPLHLLLTASTPICSAYVHPSLVVHHHHHTNQRHQPSQRHNARSTCLYYKEPSTNAEDSDSSSGANVWSVLANTERWISDTLDRSNMAANARRDTAAQKTAQKKLEDDIERKAKMHFADETSKNQQQQGGQQSASSSSPPQRDNPYVRKEVSYVCETGNDLAVVVAGIFLRIREARELGESHGRDVEARLGDNSQPTTMRQTNVVVIPNCEELQPFSTFDKLVQSINQARRSARDFVLKKKSDDDDSKDWVVSINCAHLHPNFGEPTPEEQLAAMKHEEEEGEVDMNLQDYKKRRDEARRSPYPSVIVEVQSCPPPDFGSRRDEAVMEAAVQDIDMSTADTDVTSEDVKKLEALFGMSAAKKSTSADDPFYDALGEAFGKKQIISQTPFQQAQNWVVHNDPAFNEQTSTFTKSDTRHVDAAYEYVFNNIAMLSAEDSSASDKPKRGQKSYVVLPNFVPTSATSFDRFAGQVSNIIRAMPNMAEKVMLSTFHPEHVVGNTQSPSPIIVITWK